MPCMVLFSPEMNWLNPLIEETEYETRIISAHGDTEQRQSLRGKPHRRLTFNVSALTARESGLLEVLIRESQSVPCLVPYWRGARYLNSTVESGSTAIPVNSADLAGFEVGHGAILYRSPYEVAAARVTAVVPDQVTVSPVIGRWLAKRDRIVPAFAGTLSPSVPIDYATKFAKLVPLTFDLDSEVHSELPQLPDFPLPPAELVLDEDFDYASTAAMLANWTFDQNDFQDSSISLDLFSGCRGKALSLHIPAGAKDFHVGPTATRTVSGLTVGASYIVEAQITLDLGFARGNYWPDRYDVGFSCTPGSGNFVYSWEKGHLGKPYTVRGIGIADGAGTFQVQLAWFFLAFNTVFHDATISLSRVRIFAPVTP